MKEKNFYIIGITFLCLCFSYIGYLSYNKMNTIGIESDFNGKGITKDEYIYKEDLLNLNYNIDEINIISEKISDTNVKKYLLNKKYNDLIKLISSPYFNIDNIERYQKYKDKYDYNIEKVVMDVEIGIDYDFYSNIQKSDISKNELMLVNKYNNLNNDYIPTLVTVESKYGSGKADIVAYDYFKKMIDSAKKDNIILKSKSFYRSYNRQNELYTNYVKENGQKSADTFSARPGHSEHQTGLAVDINTSSSSSHFEETKEYQWLKNNSYKYGYILRYPENKTYITGYKFEPWHFRYVGIDAANKIFQEGITFEEYYIKYVK